jgi:hypothetical protein
MTFVLYSYVSGHWNQIKTVLSWMQILARPKNTTSKTAFILYINVLEHWNRIKNGLVSKVDFEHPTLQGKWITLGIIPQGDALGYVLLAFQAVYRANADNRMVYNNYVPNGQPVPWFRDMVWWCRDSRRQLFPSSHRPKLELWFCVVKSKG